ncbi:MAG: alcohol dehydrogenase catalytic domain-containing protein [Candidatus Auribacterota bacterium]|nr:alcohol dehydrogenase catalytic domain-containing protein [Candidatus Auribacterota bacterium]
MQANTMKAIILDHKNNLNLHHVPLPVRKTGECLIKVSKAGICNTDLEIIKGYMKFHGILGHEFVGEVICADSTDLIGKRVVGEINIGCGDCFWCKRDRKEHCPNRSVLGIFNKDGCFAHYITLPEKNCFLLPDSISDEQAVFIEPLAAGLRIIHQIDIHPESNAAILGDGKLGLIIAMIFTALGIMPITLFGHHKNKMDIVSSPLIKKQNNIDSVDHQKYDYVIEATGSKKGFEDALNLVKPEGIVVLKSTISDLSDFNLAPIVINEITIIGSRCGHFQPAIKFLQTHNIPLEKMISKTYHIDRWQDAFLNANDGSNVKVILTFEQ